MHYIDRTLSIPFSALLLKLLLEAAPAYYLRNELLALQGIQGDW
jgi:hypothetical protein